MHDRLIAIEASVIILIGLSNENISVVYNVSIFCLNFYMVLDRLSAVTRGSFIDQLGVRE